MILFSPVRFPFPTPRSRALHLVSCVLVALVTAALSPALFAAKDPPMRVLTPAEALAAFQVEPGLRIELVAAEPMVDDPVALAWDEKRRLYVVENRGYPDPLQTNNTPNEPWTKLGRIALLEDTEATDATTSARPSRMGSATLTASWCGGAGCL